MARWKSWMLAPIAASALMLSGCIFMQSSSISDSAGKGSPISTQASDMGYIMLVPPGNVTQMAADQLVNQCASGKVTNVQTELTVRNYLSIVQQYEASANGVCM
jgi:hypothetical protein